MKTKIKEEVRVQEEWKSVSELRWGRGTKLEIERRIKMYKGGKKRDGIKIRWRM